MAPKKVVQDIVPSTRRSIRSIPIKRVREEEPEEVEKIEDVEEEEALPVTPRKRKAPRKPEKKGSGMKTLLVFIIIIVCIGVIATALSLLYTKAVVTIRPKVVPINIDGSFIAKKDIQSDINLSYQVVTAVDEFTKTVPATDGPLVQVKAKGTATLFNGYSSTAQKIIAGTRLSSTNGLIYRTTETVTIPGKKTSPGSISVGIIADQAGENYNALLSDLTGDFKIVAFKDTDKYATVYGRLKSDITGGFSGHKKIISADVQKGVAVELQTGLKAKLLSQIASTVPQGFIMFDDAYTIDYQPVSTSTVSSSSAQLSLKGTLYGVIFNSKNLIEYIAKKQIQASQLMTYKIDGLDKLDFKIINSKDFSAKKGTALSFSLDGPINITGTISENDLKKKLLGVKLKDSEYIIMQNTSISGSSVLLTPFWMRSFPSSPEKIIIEYK